MRYFTDEELLDFEKMEYSAQLAIAQMRENRTHYDEAEQEEFI